MTGGERLLNKEELILKLNAFESSLNRWKFAVIDSISVDILKYYKISPFYFSLYIFFRFLNHFLEG